MKTKDPILLPVACLFILLMMAPLACKKYKDGPLISVRSKTDRLSNFWVLDQYTENDNDLTEVYSLTHTDFVWRFGKDNSFDFFGTLNGTAWARSGEWHWLNGKEDIELFNHASDSAYQYRILRLKERTLWFSQTDSILDITKVWRLKEKK